MYREKPFDTVMLKLTVSTVPQHFVKYSGKHDASEKKTHNECSNLTT